MNPTYVLPGFLVAASGFVPVFVLLRSGARSGGRSVACACEGGPSAGALELDANSL